MCEVCQLRDQAEIFEAGAYAARSTPGIASPALMAERVLTAMKDKAEELAEALLEEAEEDGTANDGHQRNAATRHALPRPHHPVRRHRDRQD